MYKPKNNDRDQLKYLLRGTKSMIDTVTKTGTATARDLSELQMQVCNVMISYDFAFEPSGAIKDMRELPCE